MPLGDVLVGFSSDEPSAQFSTEARNAILTITGVDVRPLIRHSKFVFITQIGSPQIRDRKSSSQWHAWFM